MAGRALTGGSTHRLRRRDTRATGQRVFDYVRADNRAARRECERFRRFDYADLIERDKLNLDIFWLKDDSLDDPRSASIHARLHG